MLVKKILRAAELNQPRPVSLCGGAPHQRDRIVLLGQLARRKERVKLARLDLRQHPCARLVDKTAEVQHARKSGDRAEALRSAQTDLERAVTAHALARDHAVLARPPEREPLLAQLRQLVGNIVEITRGSGIVAVKAALCLGHDDNQIEFFRVVFDF